MTDQREALEIVTRLLSKAGKTQLRAEECERLLHHAQTLPGWIARASWALAEQRSGAAVDALLQLSPQIPGVVEGIRRALVGGLTRTRADGSPTPHLLALDFRHSRAKGFDQLLARAFSLFGDGLEGLVVAGRPHYRFAILAKGTLAGRAAAVGQDVVWLHGQLMRRKGTRLWLNGWRFDDACAFGLPAQAHFIRGWLQWAATQLTTTNDRGIG